MGKYPSLVWCDCDTCVRHTLPCNAILLDGNISKERQSFICLKVAQDVFVQLSEIYFDHLPSLRLDWHFKKKLGEVIKSMDRGISACDMLMKYFFLWFEPTLAELLLVCVIFATCFQYFPVAVVVLFYVFVCIVLTLCVSLRRKNFRKKIAKSDNGIFLCKELIEF